MDSENDAEVVVGEMTVQFTANGSPAKEELRELQQTIEQEVHSLEHASAVIESFAMTDFDRRLSWEGSDAE